MKVVSPCQRVRVRVRVRVQVQVCWLGFGLVALVDFGDDFDEVGAANVCIKPLASMRDG